MDEANGPRRNLGVKGLSAFDLRTMKPGGGNWNFTKQEDRKMAHKMIEEQNPDFIIGSPPCTSWCAWNTHMNFRKMDPERVKAILEEGRMNLRFVARMYRRQMINKKFFVHEQPATALSWQEKEILEIMAMSDVRVARLINANTG